jgi:type 1 fimbria pilin
VFHPSRAALLWMTLLVLRAGGARAECPTTAGLPFYVNFSSVGASNSLPVGATIPGTVRAFTIIGKCSSSALYNQPVVMCPKSASQSATVTGAYITNVAGIGIITRDSTGKPLIGAGTCPATAKLGTTGPDGSFNVSGTFELVKIGTITGGTMSGFGFDTYIMNSGYTLNNGNDLVWLNTGTVIKAVTCDVTAATANQTITLPTVSSSAFPAIGSVAGRQAFSLGLTCQAGVQISVMFTSTSGSTGVASVLGNSGTAAGIGVQLLDSTFAPITLDSPLLLTSNSTGNSSFNFGTQYYRVSTSPVNPGSVRATAIFTMIYQ